VQVAREVREEAGVEVENVHILGSQPWPIGGLADRTNASPASSCCSFEERAPALNGQHTACICLYVVI
jgi:hypothetical protein